MLLFDGADYASLNLLILWTNIEWHNLVPVTMGKDNDVTYVRGIFGTNTKAFLIDGITHLSLLVLSNPTRL